MCAKGQRSNVTTLERRGLQGVRRAYSLPVSRSSACLLGGTAGQNNAVWCRGL